MFHFCNIFDLLTSRTQKIAWWPPVFKPDFYIFSYNEQLRENRQVFIALYHTSLNYLKHSFFINISFTTSVKTFFYLCVYFGNFIKNTIYFHTIWTVWLVFFEVTECELISESKYQKDHLEMSVSALASSSAFECKCSFYTV